MKFKDFLKSEAIQVGIKSLNKKDVIEKLVDILVGTYRLSSRQEILNSVLEREALMSTGVGKGLAIPHGKVDAVQEVIGSMVILSPGVDFGSPDEMPVEIAILLMASTKETGPHIRTLAHISRVLQDDELRENLIKAKTPREIFDWLDKKEKEL
ncbi:MAG: PTS sugar transporter subunit IIA [Chlamydiae bacterium]|nr:PTS sugar transporter subunit IIA [Chlamydiota bacterium]MBI3266321.1 PTS sugar transporter subunit IIA [Chlamydiota bacterium]